MGAIMLPGAIMPATLAYANLLAVFDPDVHAVPKELEVYAGPQPPADYSLETELVGIERVARDAGFGRFHLVGYSAGGATALAFALTHPARVRSLALAEPAWTGTEGRTPEEAAAADDVLATLDLPPAEMLPAFIRAQLGDGVAPPPPPPDPPPPWMATRPAGAAAIAAAFQRFPYPATRMRAFDRPVLFALGGKSRHAYYGLMAERLRGAFPDFSLALFPERHHFDPPHRAEPERYARALEALWRRADDAQV
jgi:pimeloyl-ACP methyl ester carboxylesterase